MANTPINNPTKGFEVVAIRVSAKSLPKILKEAPIKPIEAAEEISAETYRGEVFYVVEEMPSFQGNVDHKEFRMHIARNLIYPKAAAEQGVEGKLFVKFIVTKEGKVEVPDQEKLAQVEAKPIDEVVVVAYRSLNEDDPKPDDKYIQLLKDEVKRVVLTSPDWIPGKQGGKAVDVIFTFPVTFALQ